MFTPHPGLSALYFSLFWLFPWFVLADVVNRTIDDGNGDSVTGMQVTYFPAQPNPPWANQNCAVCAIKPDIDQAFMHTYTAATWFPQNGTMSITMQFNGTAIYVFFILVNSLGGGVSTLTLVNFTLDGSEPQLYQHAADPQRTDILYNQLVYNQVNLMNTEHTLVISASQVPTSIYVNFDYAIYTHEDDVLPASDSSTSPVGNPIPVSATPSSPNPHVTSSTLTALISSAGVKSGSTARTLTMSSTSPSATPVSPGSISSNSGTQVNPTTGSKKSTPTAAIVGAVVGITVLVSLVIAGIIWFKRRHKTNSLEAVRQFPVMTELPSDESEDLSSPILSDNRSTPSRAKKLEEMDRARQLALRPHPSLVPQDVESQTSATSQNTHERRLSLIGIQSQQSGSENRSGTGSGTGDVDARDLLTGEIAQQLRQVQDQISYLRGQRQSSSTEVLLENPPPGYQPDPPSR